MDLKNEKKVIQRKKLWEIDTCYKCAVIGTCLSRSEMRQLSREKVFFLDRSNDDYQLHSQFIRISNRQDLTGKSLHRYLEKKYRHATRKYFRVETDAEIEMLWKEDLTEGRIDSAWWAVSTHPLATMELVGRLYGQLHMLGHDCIAGYYRKKILIRDLQTKVTVLDEVLGAERQAYRRSKRQLQEALSTLESERDKKEALVRDNQFLRRENTLQKERLTLETSGSLQRDSPLEAKIAKLAAELDLIKGEKARALEKIDEMKEQQAGLRRQNENQTKEIVSLEKILLQYMDKGNSCESCADRHTEKCPGRNLCGRTVLYVGGLNKLVPHYRQLVEDLGGCFMHHDGGKEASRNLLPKMLTTADAVFCPIDCVSHDACNCVKKICKRHQKPFVLMRNSSLSSLAKGLTHIQ